MLHERNSVRDQLTDDVYASRDLSVAMPRFRIPEREHDPRDASQVVVDEPMLDGMALLWKWRERRRAAGMPAGRPNLVTGPVPICRHKFTRYWDIEQREIPMEGDRLIMSSPLSEEEAGSFHH